MFFFVFFTCFYMMFDVQITKEVLRFLVFVFVVFCYFSKNLTKIQTFTFYAYQRVLIFGKSTLEYHQRTSWLLHYQTHHNS